MGEAVRLSEAKAGDRVIHLSAFGVGSDAQATVRLVPVTRATPKRLLVCGRWYGRGGRPVRRARHGQSTVLSDPTPAVLDRLREQEAARSGEAAHRAEAEAARRIDRRVAADWLADTTDPEVILGTLFPHTLDDVFAALRSSGIV